MKRASYREAIEWIAFNDSAADDDAFDESVAGSLVSAVLVADIFDVPSEKVGRDIVRVRRKELTQSRRVASGPQFAPDSRRVADRIDGYDRDDLGESPDY
jgi:hypothetical protein